jgi:alkylresorcinol/alkylpyrone synthase
MKIASVAPAFPEHVYTQDEILDEMRRTWRPGETLMARIERLMGSVRVERRHLSLPLERYGELDRFGTANDRWIETATDLGSQCVTAALDQAEVAGEDVGALFFVTVTGVSSPSVDAAVVQRLGLSRHVKRNPIFGLGCVAGASGLVRAADYVKAFPRQAAVVLSVELCSLTFQQGDLSMKNLISSCLFGDGAGAAVVVGEEHPRAKGPGPRVIDTRAFLYPDTEDVMGWKVSERGFEVVLSAGVPDVVRRHVRSNVGEFLAEHGLSLEDIRSWVAHPGGPKILEAMQESLELTDGALEVTWTCLRERGNLSSASLLVVLAETMRRARPDPGTRGLMLAMGPGFCSEMLLVDW